MFLVKEQDIAQSAFCLSQQRFDFAKRPWYFIKNTGFTSLIDSYDAQFSTVHCILNLW